jgi:hypothetical protein
MLPVQVVGARGPLRMGLHVVAPTPGMVLEAPPRGVEGVVGGNEDTFVRVLVMCVVADRDFAAGDREIDPDREEAALGVLAMGGLYDYVAAGDSVVQLAAPRFRGCWPRPRAGGPCAGM